MDGEDGERDQLVAVAISASDLLIEVDSDGVIAFLAGAVVRLGVTAAQSPVGLSFVDLFKHADRPAAREHIARVAEGRAITPLLLHLRRGGVPSMLFGGCAMPQGRTILFMGVGDQADARASLPNLVTETERGLMSRPVFSALALRRLPDDLASGLKLTFIDIRGYSELPEPMISSVAGGLSAAIARQVSVCGSGIEAVGELGRGRFGVLHRGLLRIDELQEAVTALLRAAAPAAPMLSLATATLEPGRDGIFGRKAMRVLRYAIERFAVSGDRAPELGIENDDLDALFPDTVSRIDNLEHAIDNGIFDLAYQPIVDLRDRGVRHREALVRFRDGTTPWAAVAAAEAAGMMGDFDLAVCARAIEHIEIGASGMLPVAVNLSGRSLESRGFAERLLMLIETRHVPPPSLMFELTENAILGEVQHVNDVVQRLRHRGFRFCLDDLGSGANSFHYLRSIPVDFVKIDGAFGRDALLNERDRSFLRYISGFCRENGILAIAEMIDSEADVERYLDLGIDYGQGYLFGRPAIIGG